MTFHLSLILHTVFSQSSVQDTVQSFYGNFLNGLYEAWAQSKNERSGKEHVSSKWPLHFKQPSVSTLPLRQHSLCFSIKTWVALDCPCTTYHASAQSSHSPQLQNARCTNELSLLFPTPFPSASHRFGAPPTLQKDALPVPHNSEPLNSPWSAGQMQISQVLLSVCFELLWRTRVLLLVSI